MSKDSNPTVEKIGKSDTYASVVARGTKKAEKIIPVTKNDEDHNVKTHNSNLSRL